MRAIDWRALFGRPPDGRPAPEIEDDIREELAFHIALREQELVEAGALADEAAQAARSAFGDVEQVFAECRGIELGERIMLQRINFALTVAALVMLGVFLWRTESSRAATLDGFGMLQSELASLRTTVAETPAAPTTPPGDTSSTPRATSTARALDWNAQSQYGGGAGGGLDASGQIPHLSTLPFLGTSAANRRDRQVYVLGKVAKQGAVAWSKDLTLTMVIAECGGFEEFASRERVQIIRRSGSKGQKVLDADVSEILSGKAPDVEMEKGDRVVVPEVFF